MDLSTIVRTIIIILCTLYEYIHPARISTAGRARVYKVKFGTCTSIPILYIDERPAVVQTFYSFYVEPNDTGTLIYCAAYINTKGRVTEKVLTHPRYRYLYVLYFYTCLKFNVMLFSLRAAQLVSAPNNIISNPTECPRNCTKGPTDLLGRVSSHNLYVYYLYVL